MSLPSTDTTELEKMIDLQATKFLPYDKEETVIDFQVIRITEEGFSEVMVVAVKRETVLEYVNLLGHSGLRPKQVRLDAECILDFYTISKNRLPPAKEKNIAIIDIDFSCSNVQIVAEEKLLFTRSLPFGSSTLFSKENNQAEVIHNFVDEIVNSFASYQKMRKGQDISGIILAGAGWNKAILVQKFREKFSLPVEALTDLPRSILPEGLDLESDQDLYRVSLSSLIGAPLAGPSKKIDLSPRDLRIQREKKQKRKELVQLGVLVVSILTVILAIFSQKIHNKKMYLVELNKQIKAVQPLAQQIEAMRKEIAIIENQQKTEGFFLDALSELYTVFPPQASLSLLIYEGRGSITVKGTTKNMSDVFEMVPNLEKSPLFKNVKVKYVNQRNIGQARLIDFQISLEVSQNGIHTE
jgi:Tfp pilus assembly protein PilN